MPHEAPNTGSPTVRAYRPADLTALYDICLRTGDSGRDAAHLYRDPMLLGHYYAAPYATLCPDTTFVLATPERVVGYVLGVPDSRDFETRSEREWFPLLRGLYPLPAADDQSRDARMTRALHRGYRAPDAAWLDRYPAHLHIDLLPEAQGGGHGRRLIGTLLGALRDLGVPGVHLGVGLTNTAAQGFYERLGFRDLERSEHARTLGLPISG